MKTRIPLLTLLISSLLGASASAFAKTPSPATQAIAAAPTATSAKAAPVKTNAKKRAAKPVLPPPPPPPLEDASEEQLAATEAAYLGTYDCEFKQSVSITRNIKQGYLDVMWQKFTFTMKPVMSSTGALRLEDVTGRTLMIQISNKSMLLDTKAGQRLVDECLHPAQRAAIEQMKAERAAALAPAVRAADAAATNAAASAPQPAASAASAPQP